MFLSRKVLEAATARALNMEPAEALQADATILSIGAVSLYRLWTVTTQTAESRADDIEAFFDLYLHSVRSRQELAGRVAIEACAVSPSDTAVIQGVAVWLLPELVREHVTTQLALPLDLGIILNRWLPDENSVILEAPWQH